MNDKKVLLNGEELIPNSINDGRNEFDTIAVPPVTTLTLPDVFKDGMLFEADKPVIIWGLSPYQDKIEIILFDKKGKAVRAKTILPAEDTSFIAEFEGVEPSFDEYTLQVTAGNDTRRVDNILFGRLYLACGQSNMDMIVRDIYRKEELLTAAPNKNIRIYNPSPNPCDDNECSLTPVFAPKIGGPWVAGDNIEAIKDMTAVGFVFAKEMFKKLNTGAENVPVGVLSTSRGGTVIETWLSRRAIEADPELKAEMIANNVYAAEGDDALKSRLAKQGHNNTTVLFNMKLSPVSNLNISGLIWYQGESQVGKSMTLFAKEINAFIKDLSERFRYAPGALPVAFINITPFPYEGEFKDPLLDTGAAQVNERYNEFAKLHSTTAVSVPTYDFSLRYEETEVWEPNLIHPTDKIPLAERTAELFWGITHENRVPAPGRVDFDNGKVTVHFEDTYGGLKTINNEPVKGFKFRGRDKKYYPADAIITGENTVVLTVKEVPNPAGVSYAFCNMNFEANLINSRGIPVQLFRIDG